jgi:predicted enzyme related to lactoylglutathione lyase
MLLVPPKPPAEPQLDPELQKLGFTPGLWNVAEVYPPGVAGPKGAEGQGEAWVRVGPGGHFLIVETQTRGPFGEVQGTAIYSWDAEAKAYQGQFMSSLAPLVEQHRGTFADGRTTFEGKAGVASKPVFVKFTLAPKGGVVTMSFEAGLDAKSRRPALTQTFKPSAAARRDAAHGLGGVFFKAKNPKELAGWYRDQLGLAIEDPEKWTGAVLVWRDARNPSRGGSTVFGIFKQETKYFEPSASPFMLNFRVDDLDATLARLKKAGVTVDARVEEEENGRFGWAMDPENNRIELWQPAPGF